MILRAKAPLRISFAGGGTDVSPYPEQEGGCVLNATIGRYAWGSLRTRDDDKIRINSVDLGISVCYDKNQLNFNGELDLVKAAIRRLDACHGGFDIFLHTDAPPGSGLGSSSALVVALVGLIKEFKAVSLGDYELAHLAYQIEREDLGIPGGRQDQYACAFGGFNFIEFRGDRAIVNPLRIVDGVANELEHNLLLCYTGRTRRSEPIIADQIGRFELGNPDATEGLHAQKKLASDMKNALLRRNLNEFGELLHCAWMAKKRLSKKISNPSIDELYEAARKHGALGGKITGAGGGGYMIFYCQFEQKHKVADALTKMGAVPMEFAFEPRGIQTWRVNGAGTTL